MYMRGAGQGTWLPQPREDRGENEVPRWHQRNLLKVLHIPAWVLNCSELKNYLENIHTYIYSSFIYLLIYLFIYMFIYLVLGSYPAVLRVSPDITPSDGTICCVGTKLWLIKCKASSLTSVVSLLLSWKHLSCMVGKSWKGAIWAISGCAQGFLLVLRSGITPGRLGLSDWTCVGSK